MSSFLCAVYYIEHTDLLGQVKLQKASSGYQTAEQLSLEQIRKKNEETLIELSANKLNVIISGLAEGLDALSKVCLFCLFASIATSLHCLAVVFINQKCHTLHISQLHIV
jgi:hypothetical protein